MHVTSVKFWRKTEVSTSLNQLLEYDYFAISLDAASNSNLACVSSNSNPADFHLRANCRANNWGLRQVSINHVSFIIVCAVSAGK